MFKKVVQQGHSHFDARSVHEVRGHGKMARTPLAAFFNIPQIHSQKKRVEFPPPAFPKIYKAKD
jgi:hypothetical protein